VHFVGVAFAHATTIDRHVIVRLVDGDLKQTGRAKPSSALTFANPRRGAEREDTYVAEGERDERQVDEVVQLVVDGLQLLLDEVDAVDTHSFVVYVNRYGFTTLWTHANNYC